MIISYSGLLYFFQLLFKPFYLVIIIVYIYIYQNIQMPERKLWTIEQDNVLKHLKQELNIRKWSVIARKMVEDYSMPGRTGKQCRQRYHNHLDESIIRREWTHEEQQFLYKLHNQMGNRWAIIAQKMPGRSDNCVKNHFYSKMRKAIRKLNNVIHENFKREFKEIKMNVLYKLVEATDEKFKPNPIVEEAVFESCYELKNLLLQYSNDEENSLDGNLQKIKELAYKIQHFNTTYRKKSKKPRRSSVSETSAPKVEVRPKIASDDEYEDSQYSMVFSYADKSDDNMQQEKELQKLPEIMESHAWLEESKKLTNNQRINQRVQNVIENSEPEKKSGILSQSKPKQVLNSSKTNYDIQEEIQNLLTKEGMIVYEEFKNLSGNKNGLSKPPVMKGRSDSYKEGNELSYSLGMEEQNINLNMLGQSIEGLKIGDYDEDIGIIDENDNLFGSM